MLVWQVLVDQGCLSLILGLGLAWVLLPGAVVLGQVFLRGLGVLGFRFLLSFGDCDGFCPWSSASLLDSYSEESSSWFSAGGGAGSDGGAAFFAEATGLGLDNDQYGAVGALAKRTCLSLGSEMVAICAEQVSPRVRSRPFKEQGRVPVLAVSRKVQGDHSSAEDQRLYLSLGQRM